MPAPVKVSDKLLGLARREAKDAHRSTTAQIEHWATLGRAVEVLLSYSDVLALKRAGQTLPLPLQVHRDEVHERLTALAGETDRETAKARIRATGTPVYEASTEPGMIVEVQPDGTRTVGRLQGRQFVSGKGARGTRK
jgi:ParD-like antitoxin of type II bacterial toxin-antitoxin system